MRLTQTILLRHMQRDRDYTPSHLAQQLGKSTTLVRDMLCALAEDGHVVISGYSLRKMKFRRVEAAIHAAKAPEHGAKTINSVATVPVTRTLKGVLSGYESSLMKHRSLAMLTRRS